MIRKTMLVILLLVVACYPARASTPQVVALWEPPATGSPVVVYQLQVTAGSDLLPVIETAEPGYTFDPGVLEWGTTYRARVRGVDAQGRAGPWSDWSTELVLDQGAPGGCGSPEWIVQ
jgi:hypothetical protein